jgi:D-arabinose 1-dehydrogenase-like Zn-dependent alcohol dehydrogenase
MMKAAVVRAFGKRLAIEEVRLPTPGPDDTSPSSSQAASATSTPRTASADVGVDARATDTAQQLVAQSGGGAHSVPVTAVSPVAFARARRMLRRKGTVSLVGLPPGDFPTPIFDVGLKRITREGRARTSPKRSNSWARAGARSH